MTSEQREPLIQTKMIVPTRRARRVRRGQLIDLVARGAQRKLTLISAPAGFGKTTLLADWAAESGRAVAWVSLDEGDNDPQRFAAYIAASIQRALPEAQLGLVHLLQAQPPAAPRMILIALVNQVSAQQTPVVLALDDYQAIENPEVNQLLDFLIARLPAELGLIIATRSDPAIPLARLRSQGQLVEIRGNDLRFQTAEAAEFLQKVMELDLQAAEQAALARRTEGWVAGLQMAAVALQNSTDRAGFIRSFSGSQRYIMEYLLEEALERQPKDRRNFLLHTSILSRLSGDLCDALMQENFNSQEILERLEKENLFVSALDGEKRWYRYHQLFADLLQIRLRRTEPDNLPILHRRASKWFEAAGWEPEAIKHALAAQDFEHSAQLIERYGKVLLTRGELRSLLTLLEALPEETLRQKPVLQILFAQALTFSGRLAEVENHLQNAERLSSTSENAEMLEIQGMIEITRAVIADMRGEMAAALTYAQQADNLLAGLTEMAEPAARSLVYYILSDGYFAQGKLDQAEAACHAVMEIGRAQRNPWTIAVGGYKLASLKKARGQLRAAEQACTQAIQRASELGGERFGNVGALHSAYADILRECNRLEDAQRVAVEALQTMAPWGNPTDLLSGHIILGRIYLSLGEVDRARQTLDKVRVPAGQSEIFETARLIYEAQLARQWLAEGALESAARWADRILSDEFHGSDSEHGEKPGFPHEIQQICALRVRIAEGRIDEALADLRRLEERAEGGGRHGRLIEIRILQALALQANGQKERALEALHKSLLLAAPEGYVRLYVDEGEAMQRLLRAYLAFAKTEGEKDDLYAYTSRLIDAFPTPGQGPRAGAGSGQDSLVEPLSAREREVLQLICEGASNQEIAEHLFISIHTVKRHNYHIFGKLGVNNRAQAIIRANELGLAVK